MSGAPGEQVSLITFTRFDRRRYRVPPERERRSADFAAFAEYGSGAARSHGCAPKPGPGTASKPRDASRPPAVRTHHDTTSMSKKKVLATIGYEIATVDSFLDTLDAAGIRLVVDVRAAARSRRPGFAKTRLRANVEERGIAYLHLPGLGTPAEGRAAARTGDHASMRAIFAEHLKSERAREDLDVLVDLIRSGPKVCLLCLEADPEHCHRSLVAAAVADRVGVRIEHLHPGVDD
jgi:hypothetical protein